MAYFKKVAGRRDKKTIIRGKILILPVFILMLFFHERRISAFVIFVVTMFCVFHKPSLSARRLVLLCEISWKRFGDTDQWLSL